MNRLFETEVFVVVNDTGSFTAAAKRLGITKSYVSKTVTALETRLGVRLLQRTTRTLRLTEQGEAYYERCAAIVQLLEEAEDAATTLHQDLTGRLRITVPTSFGMQYLQGPIAKFKADHPQLIMEVTFADHTVDLIGEGFDVAVRAGRLANSGYGSRRLATAYRSLFASDAYLANAGMPATPAALSEHDCILYTNDSSMSNWAFEGPAGKVNVQVTGKLMTNSGLMLIRAAVEGLGIVSVPDFHAAKAVQAGKLRPVLPQWRNQMGVYALFPHPRFVPRKARMFSDALARHFKDRAWKDLVEPWLY